MDRYELRRLDYSLSEDHEAMQAAYREFFKTHCPIEAVRAAEESGFDKSLWERLCAMGATTMALPESSGGDGATLVDLTLVAEEVGRVAGAGPVDRPRLRRSAARPAGRRCDADVVNGKQLAALDPQHDNVSGVRLIPTGSIADHIIVRDGDDVVRLTFGTRPAKVDNIGRLPMAWVDPAAADSRTVLASGADALAEYQRALDEWRVLTAAALVGLVEETMTHRRRVRQDPLHPGRADLDAAGDLASAGQHRDHRAGRPQPRPARGVVPRQRTRRAAGTGAVGVRVHGRGGVQGGHDGRACPGRPRRLRGSRRDRISSACPGLGAGRRRPRRHRQAHRRDRRRPGKPLGRSDSQWISHGSNSPTTIRPSWTRRATSCARIVTDEVIRRDRETGDNFDEGVHLALGDAGYLDADWKPESDGGFNRGAPADLGTRERPRARAVGPLGHHRHGRAVGGAVRLAGTARTK